MGRAESRASPRVSRRSCRRKLTGKSVSADRLKNVTFLSKNGHLRGFGHQLIRSKHVVLGGPKPQIPWKNGFRGFPLRATVGRCRRAREASAPSRGVLGRATPGVSSGAPGVVERCQGPTFCTPAAGAPYAQQKRAIVQGWASSEDAHPCTLRGSTCTQGASAPIVQWMCTYVHILDLPAPCARARAGATGLPVQPIRNICAAMRRIPRCTRAASSPCAEVQRIGTC